MKKLATNFTNFHELIIENGSCEMQKKLPLPVAIGIKDYDDLFHADLKRFKQMPANYIILNQN